MPGTPITVRRWQIVVAFVLLTISFVVAIDAVKRSVDAGNRANRATRQVADSAKETAKTNTRLLTEITAAGVTRRAKIAKSDLELCQNVYTTVGETLAGIIDTQTAQATPTLYHALLPSLSDGEIANLVKFAQKNATDEKQQLAKKLDPASCKKLPSQSFVPKKKAS